MKARAGLLLAKIKNSSVATAPGAVAVNRNTSPVATSTSAGISWWVYLLVAIGGAFGWELLTQHVLPLKWLPWRVR